MTAHEVRAREMTAYEGPLPVVEELTAEFWAGTAEGELRIQVCPECETPRFPPRPMCPVCRSEAVSWRPSKGRGHVWSYIVPWPPLIPPFADQAPYNVVVVELQDFPGVRIVGNVVAGAGAGLASVPAERIEIGMPVAAVFERLSEDIVLPRWMPAPEGTEAQGERP